MLKRDKPHPHPMLSWYGPPSKLTGFAKQMFLHGLAWINGWLPQLGPPPPPTQGYQFIGQRAPAKRTAMVASERRPWCLDRALAEVEAHLDAAERAPCATARRSALERADLTLGLVEHELRQRDQRAIASMAVEPIMDDGS